MPLLDHELVELAFSLPPGLKVHGTRTKVLLKQLAAEMVPRECVYRPKEGFSIPIRHWLRDELRPLLEDLLGVERVAAEGIFEPAVIERLKREHAQGTADHSHLLWGLMVFQDWHRRWGVSW